MASIQQNTAYMEILKSIPYMLNEYFINNNITNEDQAKYSSEREAISGFYPMLKAYASELDLFYGIKAQPVDANDRVAAAYLLSTELYGKISEAPQFSSIDNLACIDDYNYYQPLSNLFKQSTQIENPDDHQRYLSWNMFLSNIIDLYLDSATQQQKTDIYENLANSSLSYNLALCISDKNNFETMVEELNGIFYDCCIQYLEKGQEPEQQEINGQIWDRLQKFPSYVPAGQLQKVVNNCSKKLCNIISEDNQTLAEIMYNHHEITLLQKEYSYDSLSAEELRMHIFRQKIKQQWESPIPELDKQAKTQAVSAAMFSSVDTREYQKQVFDQQKQFQSQADFWNKYEQKQVINTNLPLKNELQNLLGSAWGAEFYHDNENTSLLYFETNQLYRILSNIGNQPVNQNVSRNLLGFSKEISILLQHTEKYYGLSLGSERVDRQALAELIYADETYPDDFNILVPLYDNIALHHKDIQHAIGETEYLLPDAKLLQQIEQLPDSLEKFETVELYYHANLAIQRLMIGLEHKYWNDSINAMQQVHVDEYNKFQENIELLSSAYPEVKAYGVEKLAQEIELGLCSSYLFPAYMGENNLSDADNYIFDEVSDIDALAAFSEDAKTGLFKITDDFIEDTLHCHEQSIDETKCRNIFSLLQQYNSFYTSCDQLQTNINQSAELLQSQSTLYCRYNLYKSQQEEQQIDKMLNYEILAQHKLSRN